MLAFLGRSRIFLHEILFRKVTAGIPLGSCMRVALTGPLISRLDQARMSYRTVSRAHSNLPAYEMAFEMTWIDVAAPASIKALYADRY